MLDRFVHDSKASIRSNGWTFAHALHAFGLSSLCMIIDLGSCHEWFRVSLCVAMACLSMLKRTRRYFPLWWSLSLVIYSPCFIKSSLSLIMLPTLFFYFSLLGLILWKQAARFCVPEAFFENYRLCLGVSSLVYLILLGSWAMWWEIVFLTWGLLLIGCGFFWQISYARFWMFFESSVVLFGTFLLYACALEPSLWGSSAWIAMMVFSSWNFLLWPARRQEKPSLEKLQVDLSSPQGLGWACFLSLEQWRPCAIYLETGLQEPVLKDEEGRLLKGPAMAWYLMQSCGGLWQLWARLFEKLPVSVASRVFKTFQYLIEVKTENLSNTLLELIEKRKR